MQGHVDSPTFVGKLPQTAVAPTTITEITKREIRAGGNSDTPALCLFCGGLLNSIRETVTAHFQMSRVRGNRVCFTVNNYSHDEQGDITRYCDRQLQDGQLTFAIIAEEIGGSAQTIHLQGFLHLAGTSQEGRARGARFYHAIPGLGRAHFESARGSDKDNLAYCSKDGIYATWGSPGNEQGTIYQEMLDILQHGGIELAISTNPELAIKHFANIRAIHQVLRTNMEIHAPEKLRAWQVSNRFRYTSRYGYRLRLAGGLILLKPC